MQHRWVAIPVLGLLILALGGCLNLQGPHKPIQFYTLEYPVPGPAGVPRLGWVLRVNRFSAAPTYNTRRMIYRDKAFQRDAYVYSQWRDNPADLVSFFLTRDLRGSGLFKAVIPEGSQESATHVVEGVVEEFLEWDSEALWEAVLSVSITLIRAGEPDASKKVVFQKTYRLREPCPEKNPAGLAAAMSRAMASLSGSVIEEIYAALNP